MRQRVIGGAALGCVLLCGCFGGGEVKMPPVVPVSGTVTLDGKPAYGAQLTFLPVGSTQGVGSFGNTDVSGKYSLTTPNTGTGAPVGDYKVTIATFFAGEGYEPPPGTPPPPKDAPPHTEIPALYSNPETTPLTAKVAEKGVTVDFELKSRP